MAISDVVECFKGQIRVLAQDPPEVTRDRGDRKAMGMDQFDYIGHLLARRYDEIRDRGGPSFEKKKERKR